MPTYPAAATAVQGPLPYPPKPCDKATWPPGEWHDEPDVMAWTDEVTGLHCAILRQSRSGVLNGYVAVPPGSPLDGRDYDTIDTEVSCHGGLTYSNRSSEGLWWFGFDCHHLGDFAPGDKDRWDHDEIYCPVLYVRRQCAKLAAGLAAIAAATGGDAD